MVFSRAVFKNIDNPEKALCDIKRIHKPGGIICISLLTWTSFSGCHDPSIFSGHDKSIPLWAHL